MSQPPSSRNAFFRSYQVTSGHPSVPPEALQYRAFPVTFPNVVHELISVELQIELQDSGSAGSREIEVYGLTVTKDLSSLGLAIIPEPTTLLLALSVLFVVANLRHP